MGRFCGSPKPDAQGKVYLSPKSYQEEALALCSLWRIEKEVCTLLEEVQGSGIRVEGSGFRVEGSGFRVQG